MQNNRKINCNNTIQKEIFISKLILVSRYMFLYQSEIITNLIQEIRSKNINSEETNLHEIQNRIIGFLEFSTI